jgi:hypothetical protein
MMKTHKLIGYFLVSIPFSGVFLLAYHMLGLWQALIGITSTLVMIGILGLGLNLIMKGE